MATELGSVHRIWSETIPVLEKQTKDLPHLGFGDMVSKAVHDYDNIAGVEITGGGLVFGDVTSMAPPGSWCGPPSRLPTGTSTTPTPWA